MHTPVSTAVHSTLPLSWLAARLQHTPLPCTSRMCHTVAMQSATHCAAPQHTQGSSRRPCACRTTPKGDQQCHQQSFLPGCALCVCLVAGTPVCSRPWKAHSRHPPQLDFCSSCRGKRLWLQSGAPSCLVVGLAGRRLPQANLGMHKRARPTSCVGAACKPAATHTGRPWADQLCW